MSDQPKSTTGEQDAEREWPDDSPAAKAPHSPLVENYLRWFTESILHGDEVHKAWLMEAVECFIEGKHIPEPRAKTPISKPTTGYSDRPPHEWGTNRKPKPSGVCARGTKSCIVNHGDTTALAAAIDAATYDLKLLKIEEYQECRKQLEASQKYAELLEQGRRDAIAAAQQPLVDALENIELNCVGFAPSIARTALSKVKEGKA